MRVLAAALLSALSVAFSCDAAESSNQQSAPPQSDTTASVPEARPAWLEAVPVELKDPTTAVVELCQDKPGEPGWLSQVRAGIYRTLCSSAAWFDGFFGNARFDDEYQAMHGSVAVGASWDERDHGIRVCASARAYVFRNSVSDSTLSSAGSIRRNTSPNCAMTSTRCRGNSPESKTTRCCSAWATDSPVAAADTSAQVSARARVAVAALCQSHLSLRATFLRPQSDPSARSDLLGRTGTLRRDDADRPGAPALGRLSRALDRFGLDDAEHPRRALVFEPDALSQPGQRASIRLPGRHRRRVRS